MFSVPVDEVYAGRPSNKAGRERKPCYPCEGGGGKRERNNSLGHFHLSAPHLMWH